MTDYVSPSSPQPSRRSAYRSVLWIIVGVSTAINLAASFGGSHTGTHLGCGIVTALSAGLLATHALRGVRPPDGIRPSSSEWPGRS
ncbi:hypothetical protein [Streptomyces sp. 8L]|uniref:hypothetical protein n=1 Tax=Streptomyces sp. 8L TaxID=2877242 RepID=UPI001CD80083|nr:hypothetical protein [Streptomyces sp. 8L]MCA1217596.1 hypothetical protein [Streptomyces sp. 8L]